MGIRTFLDIDVDTRKRGMPMVPVQRERGPSLVYEYQNYHAQGAISGRTKLWHCPFSSREMSSGPTAQPAYSILILKLYLKRRAR
jgi:hypothetical protein